MLCKKCFKPMKVVVQFTKEKAVTFNRCPICWFETRKTPFQFPSLKPKQTKYKQNNAIAPPEKKKEQGNVQRIHYNNPGSKKAQQRRSSAVRNNLRK